MSQSGFSALDRIRRLAIGLLVISFARELAAREEMEAAKRQAGIPPDSGDRIAYSAQIDFVGHLHR
jgi:hypothetical protein